LRSFEGAKLKQPVCVDFADARNAPIQSLDHLLLFIVAHRLLSLLQNERVNFEQWVGVVE
jgi:hypothetical protein